MCSTTITYDSEGKPALRTEYYENGEAKRLVAAKRGASFPVAPEKANPDVLDSHNPADVWHAIITFSDGYHAPMAHSSPAVARATISFHERAGQGADQFRVGPGTGINQGDINASTYQVEALRDYLDGGFSAYAKTWRARFTR